MDEEPSKLIAFRPENLAIGIADDRNIVIRLSGAEKEIGLTPGIGMMLVFSPTEARQFAQALIRNANKAEEGLPRA
jgi:hypothetical protein